MSQDFGVAFFASGRGKARNPPDPRYPKGMHVDMRDDAAAEACSLALPYPAPECGHYSVTCSRCGWHGIVTAAGRADDPRTLSIGCKARAA